MKSDYLNTTSNIAVFQGMQVKPKGPAVMKPVTITGSWRQPVRALDEDTALVQEINDRRNGR